MRRSTTRPQAGRPPFTRRPRQSRAFAALRAALLAGALVLAGAAPAGAVVGGTETPVGAFPWIVQVGSGGEVTCTGSLITPSVVLTAAHCVMGDAPTSVVVGRQRSEGPGGLRVRVARTTYDERFVRAQRASTGLVGDIGLLGLARPVREVPPVALPGPESAPLLYPGRSPVMAGWGITDADTLESDPGGTSLQSVALPLRSSAWCAKAIKGTYGSSRGVACAGQLKRGPTGCYGDSGGPLFAIAPTGPVQLGVTSSITRPGCVGGSTLFIKLLPGTSARAYVDAHLTPRGTLRVGRPPASRKSSHPLPGPITPLR
jgi:secreted trypsin-like serine protease